MSKSRECCLILYPNVTRRDVELAAQSLGFIHGETYPSDGIRLAYEVMWARPDLLKPTAVVNYVESPVSELHYILVRAIDVPAVVSDFSNQIAIFTPEVLIDDAIHAVNHNEQVRAVVRLAMGFVDYDPTVFGIIGTFATRAENPLLREAAVNSIGFRSWHQFRPLVETVARQDPAKNVRQRASLLLQHWPS